MASPPARDAWRADGLPSHRHPHGGAQAAERVYRSQSRRVRGPRRSRLTGRAALLALVVCSLVVALAYPMRQYVAQRLQIADQRQKAHQAQQRVQELRVGPYLEAMDEFLAAALEAAPR